VHVAAFSDLLFLTNGHIVLRLACDHTRAAPSAAVEVDDHSPFVRACLFFHKRYILMPQELLKIGFYRRAAERAEKKLLINL
jgi:hypothetical protein